MPPKGKKYGPSPAYLKKQATYSANKSAMQQQKAGKKAAAAQAKSAANKATRLANANKPRPGRVGNVPRSGATKSIWLNPNYKPSGPANKPKSGNTGKTPGGTVKKAGGGYMYTPNAKSTAAAKKTIRRATANQPRTTRKR